MKIKCIIFSIVLLLVSGNSWAQQTIGGNTSFDYLSPKTYTIAATKISGVPQYDHDAIRVISGLTPGKEIKIPGDDISKAIKNLWGQDLFSNIEVLAEKVIGDEIFLNIILTGRSKLSKFKINGVRKGEADKIREIINLYSGKTITEQLATNTENLVRGFFQEKGFLNTKVTVDQVSDTASFNANIFIINVVKSERVKIQSINIYGNEDVDLTQYDSKFKRWRKGMSVSDGGIRRGMSDTKQQGIMRIFSRSKYNQTAYKRDKATIIERFNAVGLRDAEIINDSVYTIDEKHLAIDIFIEKGEKYYFGDITWVGNSKYSSGLLDTLLGIENGDVFDKMLLEQRLFMSPDSRDVTSLYMDRGYLFFNVKPVEVNIDENIISITNYA